MTHINFEKQGRCRATTKDLKQCHAYAWNHGDATFCGSHRQMMKQGKTVCAIDGEAWDIKKLKASRPPSPFEREEPYRTKPEPATVYGMPEASPAEPRAEARSLLQAERDRRESFQHRQTEEVSSMSSYDAAQAEPELPPEVTERIKEADAIGSVMRELAELSPNAASRVIDYVSRALGLPGATVSIESPPNFDHQGRATTSFLSSKSAVEQRRRMWRHTSASRGRTRVRCWRTPATRGDFRRSSAAFTPSPRLR